jgi:hypothetical protein
MIETQCPSRPIKSLQNLPGYPANKTSDEQHRSTDSPLVTYSTDGYNSSGFSKDNVMSKITENKYKLTMLIQNLKT